MIPVELVLLLLDELRAKGIQMIETPGGRDAFEFGSAHGWIKCAAHMRDRLDQIIEERAGPDDDEPVRRPQAPGVEVEREYEFR